MEAARWAPRVEVALRAGWHGMPFHLAFACALAGFWFVVAWFADQRILDAVTGARPVTREEERRLWNLTETLCISRGLAMPRLAVIQDEALNAYASGLTRDRWAVTVTSGLLDKLDDRELSAVLAHEITHLRNGDARLGVIAAVFAGVISLIVELVFRGGWFTRRGTTERGGSWIGWLIGLAMISIAFAFATLLRFALSRNREYLADAGAVEMTADPDAMIAALRKVDGHSDLPRVPSTVRAMFLDDSLGQRFGSLLGTHPRIEQRIAALARYAGGRDVAPAAPAETPWAPASAAPAKDAAGSPWAPR